MTRKAFAFPARAFALACVPARLPVQRRVPEKTVMPELEQMVVPELAWDEKKRAHLGSSDSVQLVRKTSAACAKTEACAKLVACVASATVVASAAYVKLAAQIAVAHAASVADQTDMELVN